MYNRQIVALQPFIFSICLLLFLAFVQIFRKQVQLPKRPAFPKPKDTASANPQSVPALTTSKPPKITESNTYSEFVPMDASSMNQLPFVNSQLSHKHSENGDKMKQNSVKKPRNPLQNIRNAVPQVKLLTVGAFSLFFLNKKTCRKMYPFKSNRRRKLFCALCTSIISKTFLKYFEIN